MHSTVIEAEAGARSAARPSTDAARRTTSAASPAAAAFTAATVFVLWAGWRVRDHGYLSAEHGTGYGLGIAGLTAMLTLLLYPLRKRIPLLREAGAMRYWLQGHMVLGIVGPVLVMYHCSFAVGSLNSGIALVSMLVVAGSGIVGRFLYAKLHRGLYGRRLRLRELHDELLPENDRSTDQLLVDDEIATTVAHFTGIACAVPTGVLGGLARWGRLAVATRLAAVRIVARRRPLGPLPRAVANHFRAVRVVAAFSVYERLFALWHVVHIPLFWMMLVAIAVHVVAVHMY